MNTSEFTEALLEDICGDDTSNYDIIEDMAQVEPVDYWSNDYSDMYDR